MPPQNAKFIGVKKVANRVAIAVRLTDSSTFALANDEIKFEILPPGHAAISIMAIAIDGGGFRIITSTNVNAGSKTN